MARAATLEQLAACLRGRPPIDCDWIALLDLANRGFVTPQLAAALEARAESLPEDLWGFLADVRLRNRERDRRLRQQLADVLAALNSAGIEPTLLKGAALWATFPDQFADRMMSDLDVLVRPQEIGAALDALSGAGFGLLRRYDGPSAHVIAEFARPQDPGLIDLHQRPPGPPGLADAPDLNARRSSVTIAGGAAWVPDAAAQILYLILHDQFHDGDYWRGGFDLRHAADIARLAPGLTAGDWAWLQAACQTRLVRAAMNAQLLAAQDMFGGDFVVRPGTRATRTVARWRLQSRRPALRRVLAALALAAEWRDVADHEVIERRERERVLGPSGTKRMALRWRVHHFLRVLAPRAGKI